jgi:glycerol dehydrogenase
MMYIQGPGEFNNLETYSKAFSNKVFFLIDGFLFPTYSERIASIYKGAGSECVTEKCAGECSRNEINRVVNLIKQSSAGLAVGVGGGKTIDVAKVAANELGIPYFITPTSASTDAPVSCIAVIYTDEGIHDGTVALKRAAEIVLMDSEIVAKAPIRLFKAGMADALATWFEAQTRERSDTANNIGKGYRRTRAGMAIAKLSFDILMEDGLKALQALENGVITEAVENIIETNTLLSGLGFQNTGCSVAHAIQAGLAELPEAHNYMHGEKVAFGIVCGFIFENTPMETVDPVMRFMVKTGMPVTLEELNVKPTYENAWKIADKVVNRNKTIYSEPIVINIDTVLASVLAANALGETYKNGKSLI